MSNINEIIYETMNTMVGAGVGGLASRALTGIAAPAINSGLANAGMQAIPGLGQVLSGGLGAAQQMRLNNLQQQYDQLTGIEKQSHPIVNAAKVGLTAAASSVPVVGGFVNAWKGAQVANMNNKIAGAQNYQRYANLVSQMPQTR